MLTFLPRIRHSLIESGSAQKYLFYAIGEIALVVIGILIALQINNWNEDQKNKEIEQKMLRQVISNIENDTFIYNNGMQSLKMRTDLVADIKNEFAADLPFNDSMSTKLSRVSASLISNLDLTVYENIKSIGLEMITNDQLRNKIIRYYERKVALNRTRDMYPLGIYFRENIYPEYFQSFIWGWRAIPNNYNKLKQESKFLITLDYVDNDAKFYRTRIEILKGEAIKLYQEIDNALK